MSFSPIPYSATGTTAIDLINAALTSVDASARGQANDVVSAAVGQEAQYRSEQIEETRGYIRQADDIIGALQRFADQEVKDRIAGDAATLKSASDAVAAGARQQATAFDAYTARTDAVVAAASTAASAAVTTSGAATQAVAGLTQNLDDLRVAALLGARPGDSPNLFTVDKYAGISGVPSNASVVTGVAGRALRIVGRTDFLAPVALRAIEPGHVYKVRAAFRRIADTTDTSGDAVHFAVLWYGADRNLLQIAPQLVADVSLVVADGRIERWALMSTGSSDPGVLNIPSGAVYFRPYVAIFGDVPVTDIEVIETTDVTDATMVTPGLIAPTLDVATAAIAVLQSQVRALAAAAGVTLS